MARKKTKKQKKKADSRVNEISINLEEVVSDLLITSSKSKKNKTTFFSESQVKLLYKDLLKTAVVTLVVFIVLLLIFVYMR